MKLECPFCWLLWLSGSLWCGLLAWPWLRGWDGAVPTWSRSECVACAQISGVCSPIPPSSLYATRSRTGAKGWGRDLVLSSLSVLLLRGPTSPSLTLASAPLARGHRGRPIPARHWLPCWWNCTGAPGDTAAQGRGLEPQLGARWRRSPNTCRPVLDTVYASFCREYLNTCGERETQDLPLEASTRSVSVVLPCPPPPRPLPRPPVQ